MLATRIRLSVRTASIASRCVRASTPEPTSARSPASGRREKPRRETAHGGRADRRDRGGVDDGEETAASGLEEEHGALVRVEIRAFVAREERHGLQPERGVARRGARGIRPSAPRFSAIQRICRTGMSVSPRASAAKARAMTSTHSFIGRSRGTSA